MTAKNPPPRVTFLLHIGEVFPVTKTELPNTPENSALFSVHVNGIPNMDALAAGLRQSMDIIMDKGA